MASKSYGERAVDFARAEVGYRESGHNRTKYWADLQPDMQGGAWCGAFVAWCWYRAGFDMRKHVWPYYVPYLRNWARKIGAWKTSGQKAGDLVVYSFGKVGRFPHVGLAWPDPNASGYRAVEGNTSSGSAGSQSDGGGVYIRYRGRASIAGWVDMEKVLAHYGIESVKDIVQDAAKPASGKLDQDGRLGHDTARELQERLKTVDPTISVDGKLGPHSFRVMQQFLDAPYIDGEISRQPKGALDLGNGYRKDRVEVGDGKSQFVERWQAYVGAKVDGRLGEKTIERTQIMANQHKALFTKADKGVAVARAEKAGL